jgi:hypothetical protein
VVAILQMPCTRTGVGGDDASGSDPHGHNHEDLPPPLHPTLAKMMAQLMETQHSMGEVLRRLAQNAGHGWDLCQGPEPN